MKKLILFCLSLVISMPLMAQVTTSSMSGRITDGNGQPVAGAAVIAIHTPSGTQYGGVVDGNGSYRILNMRPGGPYQVQVQMLGFNTNEYGGIELSLGDNFVLDATLSESAVGMEEIIVTGIGRDNMSTDRAGAITTVNSRIMAQTPTVSRSINDIVRFSPQSSATSNGTAIGGGNYRQSYVTVDGASFNNMFGIGQNLPAGGSPISLDALEQITISVTPYDVRQSGFTGGAINAVTKSGDNEFRGSAYSYFNNENFKGNRVGDFKLTREESSYKMFGASFGGPIIKNKLFFFLNGEYEMTTQPGPTARPRKNEQDKFGEDNISRPTQSKLDEISGYLKEKYGYDVGKYYGYSSENPSY